MLSNSLTQKRFQLPVLNKHPQALSESSALSLSRRHTRRTATRFIIIISQLSSINAPQSPSFHLDSHVFYCFFFVVIFWALWWLTCIPLQRRDKKTRLGLTKNISFGSKMNDGEGESRETLGKCSGTGQQSWKSRGLEWNTFNNTKRTKNGLINHRKFLSRGGRIVRTFTNRTFSFVFWTARHASVSEGRQKGKMQLKGQYQLVILGCGSPLHSFRHSQSFIWYHPSDCPTHYH